MLRIFSQLRYQLMGKKKMTNYLVYAIGEIILVVIGILIALQVNNWNEARKEKLVETELLMELREDLDETIADLENDIRTATLTLAVTDSLYRDLYIQNDRKSEPYKIPFWYANAKGSLYPKMNAYQSIQSRGVQIIQNPQLRSAISDFYELFLTRIKRSENGIAQMQINIFNEKFFQQAKTSHNCVGCESLSEIMNSDSQLPFDTKSYFTLNQTSLGLDLQLMMHYKRNMRLLSLYNQAEDNIRDIQQLIDTEINP